MNGMNEADTSRKLVLPKLIDAGWDDTPHAFNEQVSFTDGRIVVAGDKVFRQRQKIADFVLRFTHDFPIAVVEVKRESKTAGSGLQQAKDYAEILGLNFAYSTNGHGFIEFDYLNGTELELDSFPTPDQLWQRLCEKQSIDNEVADRLLTPSNPIPGKSLRYYQEIAVNRAVQAILQGKKRVLITMATGTGKTLVAFQICWKLWSARWNSKGEYRRPRILYLADRNILVDDPKDKIFVPFDGARHKIHGEAIKSREMYFSTYQAIARD